MECRYNIKGLQILDYLSLYKKFIPSGRESYTLSFISQYELGDDKIGYLEEHDNITEFYIDDHQTFIEYNMYDVELIDLLDKKLGLLDLIFTIAYMAKINFEDVMSPIRTWDSIIYEHLKKKDILIPPAKHYKREAYPGAYVHEPKADIYDWVVSYDLNSLYPSLIMQYNISNETMINKREDVNQKEIDERFITKEINVNPEYILSGSGQYFSKETGGMFPVLMNNLYNDRVKIKNEMKELKLQRNKKNDDRIFALNNKQLALKILLNSAYGAMASPFFRYFSVEMAKAITLSGQLAIKWISDRVNREIVQKFKLKKDIFVYGDTDSAYICLDFVANKLNCSTKEKVNAINKFSKQIMEPCIDKHYEELKVYMNANYQKMIMKQEKISEKFLITGKKRYAALVWDDEGYRYDEPELKVTGIEIVRSSTPKAVKPFLRTAILELMTNTDKFNDYIKTVKGEFDKLSPEEIAFPRSVNDVTKYKDDNNIVKSGCPIGVRAALIYNKFIKDNSIDVPEVSDGEKIKFFYALTPNIFYNQNVFGFVNKIPNKDQISKYVDYSTQFDKVFYDVIKGICDNIGYNIDKVAQTNLEDLF
jgi:DNA polymerase elongation subunit (family B)